MQLIDILTERLMSLEDGIYDCPIVYFKNKMDDEIIAVQCDYEDKSFELIFEVLTEHDIDEYVMIGRVYSRNVPKDYMQYTQENWETESPDLYPESMREELFVLEYFNRSGKNILKIIEFRENEDEIIFENETILDNTGKIYGILSTNFFNVSIENQDIQEF